MLLITLLGLALGSQDMVVGEGSAQAGIPVATYQLLKPAGTSVTIPSRPVDLVVRGGFAYLKENTGVTRLDLSQAKPPLSRALPGGTSLTGIALSADGKTVYATGAGSRLHVLSADTLATIKTIELPKATVGGESYPCGFVIQGNRAFVALSRANALGIVNLESGETKVIPTDIAPFDVAIKGNTALVTCWSRKPAKGETTAPASGSPVPVTGQGRATGGTLIFVDLEQGKSVGSVSVGLQPSQILVDGNSAYVANANSDTVSVIDIAKRRVLRSFVVKPDWRLPFGSMPNALAFGPNNTLLIACGGNNAVAVATKEGKITGWIPTGWFPAGLVMEGDSLFIANAKGFGSRRTPRRPNARNVYDFTGTLQRVPKPLANLAENTKTVLKLVDAPSLLGAYARESQSAKPAPVPVKLGQPSVFEHVVYILKENRTYDEVFADLPRGRRDPSLLLFGRDVTPNHHAIAEQFVQLDNFYCNGVLSADGHAWAMEAMATSYFERSFGGWTRSYPYGDDPLAIAQSGYIWDAVLARGLSFRNYGEFDYATPTKGETYQQIVDDFRSGAKTVKYRHNIGVARLKAYSHPEYPGWNMGIPDVVRADIFLKDLAEMEAKGTMPNFSIVYLPQDHTTGTGRNDPSPRANVADNDLALGRVLEGISKSKFWPKTCVFVVEDDPQAGLDHVDGHRTVALVASPYTKRGALVSKFYNQTSMVHTMLRILGVSPLNQMDARSPLMSDCFTPIPNFAPYTALTPKVEIDERNGIPKTALAMKWEAASRKLDLSKPDLCDEDVLNRIVWHSVRPTTTYPAHKAGAHGTGLRKLGLKVVDSKDDDEDEAKVKRRKK
ncbi:MAG: bifunctional YncE family protein/alkaline phosphatase family protein [Fimbriimonas sp.]